jgi:PAS domain S-box-containing protein
MLGEIKGVSFFVKDKNFRLIFANPFFYRRLGLQSQKELLGKDDFELFPEPLAKKFRKDDESVMKEKLPRLGLIELFLNQQGTPAWYSTNKFPIFDKQRKAIGIMGTVQKYEKVPVNHTRDKEMEMVIEELRVHNEGTPSIAMIADKYRLSHRQLNRRFKEVTGLTPQQFSVQVRIEKACKLLKESSRSLTDIGYELGFCDQSAFTAQFRKRMSMTPRQYRKQYS